MISSAVRAILAGVRRDAVRAAPPVWPQLGQVLDGALRDPLPPAMGLPLAFTAAAGAPLERGAPFATAWAIISAAVRVLDDSADDDNPLALNRAVGPARSFNYGAALLQLATLVLHGMPPELGRDDLVSEYAAACLQLAAGQDRDLTAPVGALDEYIRLVQDKTCAGFAFGAFGGARAGSPPPAVHVACRRGGYHVGLALQLLDDAESARLRHGDLAAGRRTFPIWYALARIDRVAARALRELVFGPEPARHAARIRELLDELDAFGATVAEARKERDRALAAIARTPGGSAVLAQFLDEIFAETDALAAPLAR